MKSQHSNILRTGFATFPAAENTFCECLHTNSVSNTSFTGLKKKHFLLIFLFIFYVNLNMQNNVYKT